MTIPRYRTNTLAVTKGRIHKAQFLTNACTSKMVLYSKLTLKYKGKGTDRKLDTLIQKQNAKQSSYSEVLMFCDDHTSYSYSTATGGGGKPEHGIRRPRAP